MSKCRCIIKMRHNQMVTPNDFSFGIGFACWPFCQQTRRTNIVTHTHTRERSPHMRASVNQQDIALIIRHLYLCDTTNRIHHASAKIPLDLNQRKLRIYLMLTWRKRMDDIMCFSQRHVSSCHFSLPSPRLLPLLLQTPSPLSLLVVFRILFCDYP